MMSTEHLTILLRRFSALLLVGVVLLMASGMTHGGCTDGDHEPEKAEHVVFCKCACHHHLYVPNIQSVSVRFSPVTEVCLIHLGEPVSDAEPSGIFHPPKHLV